METTTQDDDFDIAKAISEKLRGLPKDRQERLLRWVSEGIGLSVPAPRLPVGGSLPPADLGPPGNLNTQTPNRSDIKTFVAAKAPKSDQQFAAVVAYYYRFEAPPADRKNYISGEILQEAARLAGRKRPRNPGLTLNNAKRSGYLDSGSAGEFAINSVGENLVAMTLPGDGGIESLKAKKPRRSSNKKRTKRRK